MVYCNLISKNAGCAEYGIGTMVNNITGRIVYYSDGSEPKIIEHPHNETISMFDVNQLLAKYSKKFAASMFPDKISYEIG